MFNIVLFLVTIGILVVIHEYGHFIVARKCGVKVERFSIGFGKRLCSWYDKQGTEFTLSLIPLGGYVKMLDERVDEVSDAEKHQAFTQKTIGQRAMIIAAGPIANFILAFVIFWVMAMIGTETRKSIILSVEPMSIAAKAGIRSDEIILEINNQSAQSLVQAEQILRELALSKSNSVTMLLQDRYDETNQFERILDFSNLQFDAQHETIFSSLGLYYPEYPLIIDEIMPDSPALKAGLLSGDSIIALNSEPVRSRHEFIRFINYHGGESLVLTIERNSIKTDVTITPEKTIQQQGDKEVFGGRIGISFSNDPLNDEYMMNNRYNPLSGIWVAGKGLAQNISLIMTFLFDALKGNASMSDLVGPVGIAQVAGSQFAFGLTAYLGFLAVLSINLGIMNLLPIPVLDGGHLLFLAVEKIKGSPVSVVIQQKFYLVGAFILLSLMVMSFISDVMRF